MKKKTGEKILEEKGVYGDVRIGEYHLDMIPFDDDVLSLELEGAYREIFLVKIRDSIFFHFNNHFLVKYRLFFFSTN